MAFETQEQKNQFIQSLASNPQFTSSPLTEQTNIVNTFGISQQDIANALNAPLSTIQSYFSPPTTAPAAATPATTPAGTTAPATVTPVKPPTTTPAPLTTPVGVNTTTPITTTPAPTLPPLPASASGSVTQGSPLPNITTTQQQITAAPSWYTNYLNDLAKNSAAAVTGAQFVGAQPLQEQAFSRTAQTAGQFTPTLQQAMGLTTTAAGQDSMTAAQPYLTAAGRGTYEDIGKYMNPYTKDVVGQIGALGQRAIEQNLAPGVASGLVGAGQFGSRRGAQVLGQAIRDAQQNILAQQTQALQSGYGQALQAAQADLARQANLAGTAGALAGSDISRDLSAAQQLGALAQAGQGMNLGDINALATMGSQQQQIGLAKQLFPLQLAAQQAGILRGYTIPTSTASTYTGPIPGAYNASPLQQIAGITSLLGGLTTPQQPGAASPLENIIKGIGGLFPKSSSGGTTTGGESSGDIFEFPGITYLPGGGYKTSAGDVINNLDYSDLF